MSAQLFLLLVLTGCAIGAGRVIHRRRRRKQWMAAPFPGEWEKMLKRDWPLYGRLPEDIKKRFHGYVQIFLAEKNFEGCGGLELTQEIRVLVAAQACLLLAGRDTRVYPKLKSVLIYPDTYIAGGKGIFGGKLEEPSVRLGESWQTGTVILSWDSVKGGAKNMYDGHNVTLHEFAHQLDQEDGNADGAPLLESTLAARTWATCFQHEFKDFMGRLEKGKRTVIDEYGATNGAEFFSTATEAFFEKPGKLSAKRPELYRQLKAYYRLDPAGWNS